MEFCLAPLPLTGVFRRRGQLHKTMGERFQSWAQKGFQSLQQV